MSVLKKYSTGFVKSKDGTKIHYRQIGSGKGLVLVHGAMMYSQNFMTLAELLSNYFTVYIPDRCGRGLSETHKDYSLLAESEDLLAILNQTDTQFAFGLSSGAIIVLQTAILSPILKKIVLYEPPIYLNDSDFTWMKNYKEAIENKNFGKAFISIIKGTDDIGSLMKLLPSFITVPFMNIGLNSEAKKNLAKKKVSLKSLIVAMQYDNAIVHQSKGLIDCCKKLTADTLLLGGQKSQFYLKNALVTLSAALPKAKRVEFSKVGHMTADNSGNPILVAEQLKMFLLQNPD